MYFSSGAFNQHGAYSLDSVSVHIEIAVWDGKEEPILLLYFCASDIIKQCDRFEFHVIF